MNIQSMCAPWHPARFAQCQGRVDDPEKACPRSPKRAHLEGSTCGLALQQSCFNDLKYLKSLEHAKMLQPLTTPYIKWMKHAQTTKPWVQNSVHSCRNQGCIFLTEQTLNLLEREKEFGTSCLRRVYSAAAAPVGGLTSALNSMSFKIAAGSAPRPARIERGQVRVGSAAKFTSSAEKKTAQKKRWSEKAITHANRNGNSVHLQNN